MAWRSWRARFHRDETQQFFHVRRWDADDLIDELLGVYDRIDVDVRAQIPLERVRTLAALDES